MEGPTKRLCTSSPLDMRTCIYPQGNCTKIKLQGILIQLVA
ncbi:hypothetical protein L195_g050490, partial [Trifolium pratense]